MTPDPQPKQHQKEVSCDKSCSPSDWRKGGKCDINGCYEEGVPPAAREIRFQNRVNDWIHICFGSEIARDKVERNHRFIEEALELVQSCGATESECMQLVQYVYSRHIGEKIQEVGGVMVTLAALCLSQEINMYEAGEIELKRIWTKIEKIREKQSNKPKHSPLPASQSSEQQIDEKDKEIEKLKDLLVKYEDWEAGIISNDEMWWPNKAKDSLPDEIYETMLKLQAERNELLKRFTPESYKNNL